MPIAGWNVATQGPSISSTLGGLRDFEDDLRPRLVPRMVPEQGGQGLHE